jgi:hypothetical protein
MKQEFLVRWLAAVAMIIATAGWTSPQQPRNPAPKPRPRLEAVAETKLLMEGLMQANFRGLERNLKQSPADDAGWIFARGQALLIAETGNLLLMRPPRSGGQDVWNDLAADLRERGTRLARAAAAKDLDRSRAALLELATACNRCHQTFGQATRITPFAETPP